MERVGKAPDDLEAAREIAFRFLAYAARSSREITERLERDGFLPGVIDAVLAECELRGWVDDSKFARDWIEDRADRKRYGKARLKQELQRKGIDRETLDAALEGVEEEDEVRRALIAAQSKWKADAMQNASHDVLQAEKRKLTNFLMRRGFEWSTIRQVLAQLLPNE